LNTEKEPGVGELDLAEYLKTAPDAASQPGVSLDEAVRELLGRMPVTGWFREDHLAERMTRERKARGWSQERLATELRKIGYHLPQSSIWKIENPTDGKRRGITVDDAVALSVVFDISLLELLSPPGRYDVRALEEVVRGPELIASIAAQTDEYQQLVKRVAHEVVNGNLGAVIGAELQSVFGALNVDSIPDALRAIESVALGEIEEPARHTVAFLRDVATAVAKQPRRSRSRGAKKGGRS
jgi:transcriptional regulator with XRE-family HTH domain